jgi:ankyrin repeat protein
LVSLNAAVDGRGTSKHTPLHTAALYGHAAAVNQLLELQANINAATHNSETPLHMAAVYGHTSAIEVLLAKAADINATNRTGHSALQVAVAGNSPSGVPMLLRAKANPDCAFGYNTLLGIATTKGNHSLALSLLEHRAKVNELRTNTPMPLHIAVRLKHRPLMTLLLDNRADPTLLDVCTTHAMAPEAQRLAH